MIHGRCYYRSPMETIRTIENKILIFVVIVMLILIVGLH